MSDYRVSEISYKSDIASTLFVTGPRAFFVAVALILGGCATITSNEMQTVAVSTKLEGGQPVDKAKCTLANDKGHWTAESPGMVAIHRSSDDLIVECKKDGVADGFLRVISRAAGGMWGNIIFGGGIGALIDHNKGTGYDYPNDLPVMMGASSTLDSKRETKNLAVETSSSSNPGMSGGDGTLKQSEAAKNIVHR